MMKAEILKRKQKIFKKIIYLLNYLNRDNRINKNKTYLMKMSKIVKAYSKILLKNLSIKTSQIQIKNLNIKALFNKINNPKYKSN